MTQSEIKSLKVEHSTFKLFLLRSKYRRLKHEQGTKLAVIFKNKNQISSGNHDKQM